MPSFLKVMSVRRSRRLAQSNRFQPADHTLLMRSQKLENALPAFLARQYEAVWGTATEACVLFGGGGRRREAESEMAAGGVIDHGDHRVAFTTQPGRKRTGHGARWPYLILLAGNKQNRCGHALAFDMVGRQRLQVTLGIQVEQPAASHARLERHIGQRHVAQTPGT